MKLPINTAVAFITGIAAATVITHAKKKFDNDLQKRIKLGALRLFLADGLMDNDEYYREVREVYEKYGK